MPVMRHVCNITQVTCFAQTITKAFTFASCCFQVSNQERGLLYIVFMVDFLSKAMRSKVMATVHSSGNKDTELALAVIFRRFVIKGWRRQQPIIGRPDFVFKKEKVAVFVDGCFWHGCPWHCRMPKSRLDYWRPKIERNRRRDKKVNRILLNKGWRIHRIWEHSLKSPHLLIAKLRAKLGTDLHAYSEDFRF
jgi:DNA mismatch endonuclease, patch repair protein